MVNENLHFNFHQLIYIEEGREQALRASGNL